MIERFQEHRVTAVERFCERWAKRCGVPRCSLEVARGFLRAEGEDPRSQVLIGFADGEIAACGLLRVEPDLSRCVAQTLVAPDAYGAGLAEELFAAAFERTRSAGMSALHIPATLDCRLSSRLRAASFRVVRRFGSWELRASDFTGNPTATTSLRLRPYADGVDAAAIATLQNVCFRGAFGYQPNRQDDIIDYVDQRGGPENLLIAHDESGAAVAYVWVSLHDRCGRIEMIGVHPAHRRRGHGHWIVSVGIGKLLNQGASRVLLDVDTENRHAIELYQDLGFVESDVHGWFEKLVN